ncbi:MAG: GAF domain-containing protein [Chloroflexi bacterium]|nr:GAF domain-containing protein [Chloroflexota bacterium]
MSLSSSETKEPDEQRHHPPLIQHQLQESALQAAANGIFITSVDGEIIWANQALAALTGYEIDELIGANPRLLRSGAQDETYYRNMWQTIAAGNVWRGEVINRRKDGSLYTEDMTITPMEAASGEITHFIAVKQDISERKQKEERIKKNQQSQEVLNRLLQLLLEEDSLDTLLQRALDIIISPSLSSVQAKGSIFLVDPESPELVMVAQRNLEKPLLTYCARVPFGHCLCGRAAATGETLFANCVDHRHEITYEGMSAHGHFNVPISLYGEVVGVLNLYVEEGHQQDEREIAFLETVANTLASLIKRKRTEDALEEQHAFLRQVVDVNPSLVFAKDRDGRYILANQAMADVYGSAVEDLIGKTDADFVRESANTERFLLEDQEIMDTLKEKQVPMDIAVDAEGNKRRFLMTKCPIVGPDGKAQQILGVATDVTQLAQAEEALRQSEEQIRRIIDTALDAVISINEEGVTIGWNLRAESMFGWSSAEAIGQSLNDTIIPSQYSEAHSQGMKRYLTTGKYKLLNRRVEITAVHRDGHEFPIELSISPNKTEDGYIFNAFLRDITERKEAEETLKRSQAEIQVKADSLSVVNAITDTLYRSRDLKMGVERAVEEIQTYTQAPTIAFYTLDEEAQCLTLATARGVSKEARRHGKTLPLQGSLSGITVARKEIVISHDLINDDRVEPRVLKALKKQGLKSVFSLPLLFQEEVLGVINCIHEEVYTVTSEEQETLMAIGHTIGLALANAQHVAQIETEIIERRRLQRQIQESLERRGRQVQLSTQISQGIVTAPDLPHLYRQVINSIKEVFDYYHTQLLRYDPALDVVLLVVGYGDTGEQMLAMHHSMPMGVGLIGAAAATGQTFLRPDTAADPDWQANPLLPHTKGEIAVPIKLGDEVLGVLDVQSDKRGELNENDQLLLEGLCGQIAAAIEGTQLRQEMTDRLRELNTLQRYMSREGWQAYRETKTQMSGFWFDRSGVQPIAEGELPRPKRQTAQPKNGQTTTKGKGESAVEGDELIDLPLMVRGETIGSLVVENDPQQPLSIEESEFLNAVVEQVSEALEAARLFEQTQDALSGQERLASELSTVAEVSTAASTILDVNNLLQTVVELVNFRFGLYHTHIYLVDETGDKLVLWAGAGDVGQIMLLEGREIPFDAESLAARAARTQKGVYENDVRRIVDFMPHPLLPDTRAEMAMPLIVGGRLVGVLDLQSDMVGHFSEEAMEVQRTLASQIAVAVQNAIMYADQVETSSKLRQLDKLKSEFLASMSHELRTPLNSIIGFADVLLEGLDGELNERMEQDVRLIRDSGAHLRDLIGDILDMSKIEAGRMELRYEEVDMRQIANDILATANPLAQEKNLALNLNLADDVGVISADRTRVRQILWNIMGNAIKFTEKGNVTLSMKKDREMLRVTIRDTGIGIRQEDVATVFEQFQQVDGSLNRSVGGTGLGMPITKKLVELHGGEIGVDSVPGQGSTFWFTLSCQRPQARLAPETGVLSPLDA